MTSPPKTPTDFLDRFSFPAGCCRPPGYRPPGCRPRAWLPAAARPAAARPAAARLARGCRANPARELSTKHTCAPTCANPARERSTKPTCAPTCANPAITARELIRCARPVPERRRPVPPARTAVRGARIFSLPSFALPCEAAARAPRVRKVLLFVCVARPARHSVRHRHSIRNGVRNGESARWRLRYWWW